MLKLQPLPSASYQARTIRTPVPGNRTGPALRVILGALLNFLYQTRFNGHFPGSRSLQGGTIAPSTEARCNLMLLRSHMRELEPVYHSTLNY
jgi:hypothetical protein